MKSKVICKYWVWKVDFSVWCKIQNSSLYSKIWFKFAPKTIQISFRNFEHPSLISWIFTKIAVLKQNKSVFKFCFNDWSRLACWNFAKSCILKTDIGVCAKIYKIWVRQVNVRKLAVLKVNCLLKQIFCLRIENHS